ncbi:CehA/McbA family metallohydrolase [Fictibacillus nanhaiensis]|uniref:CehA/McbA family metallohydrolase n=1 Tax=Fictibacillus nanhaiensis TaxID=742169 RepID=UPI001C9756FC|nr:CehA/McbA family metallohydrolase [Fictibacillus nanhaiensis]MBY6036679.1 CehA/McbA family metallohydrolase [Fictibacillus nanhaiensis]
MKKTFGLRSKLVLSGTLGFFLLAQNVDAHGDEANVHQAIKSQLLGKQIFFGDLHNHTGYSPDGTGTPKQAFESAKAHGLDFIAITEHSEGLNLIANEEERVNTPLPYRTEWEDIRYQAEQLSDDSFTAIRGFEWSDPYQGHFNVWFSEHYTDVFRSPGTPSMKPFWNWFQRDTALFGGSDGIGGFNHPGREPGKLDNLAYVPEADERVVSIEVFNRDDIYDSTYVEALDKGWHVGAIGVSDHHGEDWGAPTFARTGIITNKNSHESVRSALEKHHVYATQDANYQMVFTANGQMMGAKIASNEPVDLQVMGYDPDAGETIVKAELVTNGGEVVETYEPTNTSTHFMWNTKTPKSQESAWYFVRMTQSDGEMIYSSPIWVQPTS